LIEISGQECKITTDDHLKLVGPAIEGINIGDELNFVIRPEWPTFEQTEDYSNSVSGFIQEVVYIGETCKYAIKTGENNLFLVKHPIRPGEKMYKREEKVTVSWHTKDVITLCK
jgi:putative spermidine/putrescine transport system ATP-binding protein